ncbi:MAG: flagellar hook capping FlgD N-terminal domain-containing protein [Paracoccaceae bacterium]
MEISPTSTIAAAGAAASQSTTGQASTVISSDFETFLQMLTAQAKYQDPLEPLDSTEYASQLAQFSSVEQQVKTNDLLSSLASQIGSSNMAQFASWIGMEAQTTAPVYFDGSDVAVTPETATAADAAFLVATDRTGKEVSRQQIEVSDTTASWNGTNLDGGRLSEGFYNLSVESRARGEVISSAPVQSYTRITEARLEGGQTVLVLQGGGKVAADQITALREPS